MANEITNDERTHIKNLVKTAARAVEPNRQTKLRQEIKDYVAYVEERIGRKLVQSDLAA